MNPNKSWFIRNIGFVFIIIAFLISFTPYLFTQFQTIQGIDFNKTGGIGDTIGGITAPFVNLFAAFLVYLALKEQIKANDIQINSLNEEKLRYENETKFNTAIAELNWCSDEYKEIKFNNSNGLSAIDEVMKLDSKDPAVKSNQLQVFQNILGLGNYLNKIVRMTKSIDSPEHKAVLSNKLLFIYRNQTRRYKSKIFDYAKEYSVLLNKSVKEISEILLFDEETIDYLEGQKFNFYHGAYEETNE
jgi:hypothetical protein